MKDKGVLMTMVLPLVNMTALSAGMMQTARTDNAYGGYCAKGVANILEAAGLDCSRGNAHTWDETLPQNGWEKLEGVTPENAPPGAVIVYDRDANYSGKGGGAEYGHVEIVAMGADGERQYVSDAARSNWGGTVPDNFVGVYINPDIHRTVGNGPVTDATAGTDATNTSGGSTTYELQGNEASDRLMRETREANDRLAQRSVEESTASLNTMFDFNGAAGGNPMVMLMTIISQLFGIDIDMSGITQSAEETAENDAAAQDNDNAANDAVTNDDVENDATATTTAQLSTNSMTR